ncbi:hypothetical protein BN873_360050 [Candidatus Competibacter denitrificans Run_A_D11]|uniref:Uncharacterized protein n=1 Tax=Candidatus Competibacter denitrificans Run_A_D11 TaxID=1400863 RepID=W6M506_9GAMM|nr:hypothetical protein BN873_360050 [Candidatus Competibacter denitrificans Run_A_D11]
MTWGNLLAGIVRQGRRTLGYREPAPLMMSVARSAWVALALLVAAFAVVAVVVLVVVLVPSVFTSESMDVFISMMAFKVLN